MKLTIPERFIMLGVLPSEGNFVTLRVVRDLYKNLSFSEEEIKEYSIKIATNNGVSNANWDVEKGNVAKEIKIGEMATQIIVDQLKKMNTEKRLKPNMMTVYEKFVENGGKK